MANAAMAEVEPRWETERVITAMVTPFHEDLSFNPDGAQELANYLIEHGSDGLVLAGTTGESPTLTVDEQLQLFEVVREAVGPEPLLIGGTGSNSTEEAVELTAMATDQEAVDGILAVSPYYNRPAQYGLSDYYRKLALATDLPIVLYNIPVRTGREVALDTIRRLVDERCIAAVKDATGSTAMAEKLHQEYGDNLIIYSGDDNLNLAFASVGAVGAISVASHWAGREMQHMFGTYFRGKVDRAAMISGALQPSGWFESVHKDAQGHEHDTPNPIPTKVMMGQILGRSVIGDCRPPMLASPEEMVYLERRAPQVLEDLHAAMSWL